ncbi:protein prenyltransferase [Hamiltosporidium magnivora]|uniref:Protein prenyltransferase n=1 Tax=Hamiltosporidium magnivora TaxID=148818 RepID=A0A4Q9KYB9_9MICR|nr:protein prenyltransferase [Hamiltosporidium magnivora]
MVRCFETYCIDYVLNLKKPKSENTMRADKNFNTEIHKRFIIKMLKENYDQEYESLAVWIPYWCISSLILLDSYRGGVCNIDFKSLEFKHLGDKILKCHKIYFSNKITPHLCNVYASICTLKMLNRLEEVKKDEIVKFMWNMKNEDGSFSVYETGDSDVRGIYCSLAISRMLTDINTTGLFLKSKEFILECQSYEGGFGSIPGGEAHGGYTYCAVASLIMMNVLEECNIPLLIEWLSNRQKDFKGGFTGRTNKNQDSCYGFWIGACIKALINLGKMNISQININSVKDYVFKECEDIKNGGFSDKPGNTPDCHHTCYTLLFLSIFDTENMFKVNVDHTLGLVEFIK